MCLLFRTFTFLLVFSGFASSLQAVELNVYGAASLSDALKEIAKSYEPSSGDKLVFNLGASSTLAMQIKQGAPADLFFSADEAKMDDLASAGLVAMDTRRSVLSNTLVIVINKEGNAGSITSPADLAKPAVRKIALAETKTVPAGVYAKNYLEKKGLWKGLSDKIIPTENVRACLAAVESGNVDAGIVYKTDALISKKVKVAYEITVEDGPKISYPVAVLKDAKNAGAARKFAIYLSSPEAGAVFIKYGFLPAR